MLGAPAAPAVGARLTHRWSLPAFAGLLSLLLYAATLALVDRRTTFSARWLALPLWLLAVALVPIALVAERRYPFGRGLPTPRLPSRAALPLLLAFLVGFGPKLLFVTPSTFLHTGESFSGPASQVGASGATIGTTLRSLATRPSTLAQNYRHSLAVYLNEPTRTSHYPDWQPLLDPLVGGLFLIGVVAAVLFRNGLLRPLVVYAAVIPFTNSAMTNSLNGDNRLLPLLPVAAALAGYGAAVSFWTLRPSALAVRDAASDTQRLLLLQRATRVLGALLIAYLLLRGVRFFATEPAAKGYAADDYLAMHTLYFLSSQPGYRNARQVCLALPPARFAALTDSDNLLLVSEQDKYFLPGVTIRLYSSGAVADNEVYVSTSCDANLGHHFVRHRYCVHHDRLTCLPHDELILYAEDTSAPARPAEGLPFLGVTLVILPQPTYIP